MHVPKTKYVIPRAPTVQEVVNEIRERTTLLTLLLVVLLVVLGLVFVSLASAQTITTQPQNVTVQAGQTATFTVSFSGGTCDSVWYSSSSAIGNHYGPAKSTSPISYSVANTTVAESGSTMQVILFGCSNGTAEPLSSIATLTVNPSVPLSSISISPASPPSIIPGQLQILTVTGTYTDSSTANLTSSATWTSSNTAIATTVSGVVTAVAPGTAMISASFENQTASVTVTVILGNINLTINPNSVLNFDDGSTVYNGLIQPQQFNSTTSTWVNAGSITSSNGALSGNLSINPNLASNGNIQLEFSLPNIGNMGTLSIPLIRFQQGSTGISLTEILFKAPFLSKLLAVEKVSSVALTP